MNKPAIAYASAAAAAALKTSTVTKSQEQKKILATSSRPVCQDCAFVNPPNVTVCRSCGHLIKCSEVDVAKFREQEKLPRLPFKERTSDVEQSSRSDSDPSPAGVSTMLITAIRISIEAIEAESFVANARKRGDEPPEPYVITFDEVRPDLGDKPPDVLLGVVPIRVATTTTR